MLCSAPSPPMTGVIVRSSANVQAGAVSRRSTILHGAWILAFVALLPSVMRAMPMATLGAVLVVTGWRLVKLDHARELLKHHGVLPVVIWATTRSEEHTSELPSLMRISSAVFCLKKKT